MPACFLRCTLFLSGWGWLISSVLAVEVYPPLDTPITRSLQNPIEANWNGVPLEDILKDVQKSAGVPLTMERQYIKNEGIDLSVPVTLQLGRVTVGQALPFLLENLGLACLAGPNELRVTTQSLGWEPGPLVTSTRVYDISVLVEALQGKLMANNGDLPANSHLQKKGFYPHYTFGVGFPSIPSTVTTQVTSLTVGQFGRPFDDLLGQLLRMPEIPIEILVCSLISDFSQHAILNTRDGIDGIVHAPRRLTLRQPEHFHQQIYMLLQTLEDMATGKNPAMECEVPERLFAPSNADARQKLQRPVTVDHDQIRLPELLAEIAGTCDLPLYINMVSLADDATEANQMVTAHRRDVPAEVVLLELLEPLGLGITIQEGCLVIATQISLNDDLYSKLYRVGSFPEFSSWSATQANLNSITSGDWTFSDENGYGDAQLITRDLLLIRQTDEVHQELSELFAALRQAGPIAATPTAETPEWRLYPVPNPVVLADLQRLLPQLIGEDVTWPEGAIERLGNDLLIHQTPTVHRRIGYLMQVLQYRSTSSSTPVPQPDCPKK